MSRQIRPVSFVSFLAKVGVRVSPAPGWLLAVSAVAIVFFSVSAGQAGTAVFGDRISIDEDFYYAYGIAAADLDGDGDLDVAGASYGGSEIAWWENTNGDGSTWVRNPIDVDYASATSVHLADLDGDGDTDVIGTASADNEVTWWENAKGDGSVWTEHVVASTFASASLVAAADIDGDGHLDLLGAAREGGEIAWWRNVSGLGTTWTRQVVSSSFTGAETAEAADLDGDGDLDVIAASEAGAVSWWENRNGQGTEWTKRTVASGAGGAQRVFAADIDGDEDLDAFGAAVNAGRFLWWENDAGTALGWTAHEVASGYGRAYAVAAADLNGDGHMDLIGTTNSGDIICWQNADGKGGIWTAISVGSSAGRTDVRHVNTGDMDGDGDPDVLAAHDRALSWQRNDTVDDVAPSFRAVAVDPPAAWEGTTVTITLSASEALVDTPTVTVNGNPTQYVSRRGNRYAFTYVAKRSDLSGDSRIVATGTDLAGNAGTTENTVALHLAIVTYVDSEAAAGGDGTSWDRAMRTIGEALTSNNSSAQQLLDPSAVLEIWVAKGTYRESLTLESGVSLFGGFDGTKTAFTDRNLAKNPAVIDASRVRSGLPAYHAVLMDGITTARLDSFRITGGRADGTGADALGGGIYCEDLDQSVSISSCTVLRNSADFGGGIAAENCGLTIANCTVSLNSAQDGGGMDLRGASMPVITGCVLRDNTASRNGGGMHSRSSKAVAIADTMIAVNSAKQNGGGLMCRNIGPLTVTNCTVIGNTAELGGGGVYATNQADVSIDATTVSGNTALQSGGGVGTLFASVSLTNCVVSGNYSARNGGGLHCEDGIEANVVNCTVAHNTASLPGGAVALKSSRDVRIANTIFAENPNRAIYDSPGDDASNPTLEYCLFHNNYNGPYLDPTGTVQDNATSINLNLQGASNNKDGNPTFVMGRFGTWSDVRFYDTDSPYTELTDPDASFTPDEMAWKLLIPNTSQLLQTLIVSNTATTIRVIGRATNIAAAGNTYQIADYHLGTNSAAVDQGTAAGAPSVDKDGNRRPVDVAGLGQNGTGQEFDVGAYERQTQEPAPIRAMIESFYDLVLGRSPEAGAVDAWHHGYFEYALSFSIDIRFIPREMARLFFLSGEYAARGRSDAEFITDCYQVFLQRLPNTQELGNWTSGVWNRSQVMTIFSESEEFANRIQAMYPDLEGTPARNFVTFMYIGLLDRLVDQSGLEYASGLFDAAFASGGVDAVRAQAKQMAREVIVSAEFLGRQPTTADYVVRFYRAFLGRFPNDSEIAYWTGELDSGRRTTDNLIDLFADSTEFTARLQVYFGS